METSWNMWLDSSEDAVSSLDVRLRWEWQMISNFKDVKKEKGNGPTCIAWLNPDADRFRYLDRAVW